MTSDDELVALRRERADLSSEGDQPLPSASAAIEVPLATAVDGASQADAVDDEQARAFVVETLRNTAMRCFADACALRARADRAPAGPVHEQAAARCDRAGRYAEAAADWLIRNGANALLGQGALLDDRLAMASDGAPR